MPKSTAVESSKTEPLIRLRPPVADDAQAVNEMSNLPLYRRFTSMMPFVAPAETARFLDSITVPNCRYVVAEVEGKAVGLAGLTRYEGRRIHSAWLAIGIHDHFQGRGIGGLLMAALIDIADNWWQLRRVELTVQTENTNAVKLYRRFGFEIEGTHRAGTFRDGAYADTYTMARLRLEE